MKEFEKWISKAENDLLSIVNNFKADKIPVDVCCFHAQQAAEKYLKAYSVSKNTSFPKTHDLEALLHLCIQRNKVFVAILNEARDLAGYAIDPRYPDIAEDITIKDAKQAFENSMKIKQSILQYFFD